MTAAVIYGGESPLLAFSRSALTFDADSFRRWRRFLHQSLDVSAVGATLGVFHLPFNAHSGREVPLFVPFYGFLLVRALSLLRSRPSR
jgi:hypothetical protein